MYCYECCCRQETSENGLRQEIQRLRNQVTTAVAAAGDQDKVIKELEQHCAELRKEVRLVSLHSQNISKKLKFVTLHQCPFLI